jgi:hypothetical protein
MKIPVLVEPQANGYRASTNSPVALSADGASEQDAIAALRQKFGERLPTGSRILYLSVSTPDEIIHAAEKSGENPLFDDYLKAVEEYRRIENAVPELPE